MSAIPPATRSRGNSSRMIPNASGKIAPPSPWIVRAPIITGSVVASAASSVPAREPDEHHHERPLLAEHVAQAAGDRRRHRRGEEVGGEDPRHACRRRVEIVLKRRQRRHDERLEHGERCAAEGEDSEHEAGARRGRLRRHPRRIYHKRSMPSAYSSSRRPAAAPRRAGEPRTHPRSGPRERSPSSASTRASRRSRGRAGVGVGTLYRRFPTKDALVDAVFEEHLDDMAAAAERALEARGRLGRAAPVPRVRGRAAGGRPRALRDRRRPPAHRAADRPGPHPVAPARRAPDRPRSGGRRAAGRTSSTRTSPSSSGRRGASSTPRARSPRNSGAVTWASSSTDSAPAAARICPSRR